MSIMVYAVILAISCTALGNKWPGSGTRWYGNNYDDSLEPSIGSWTSGKRVQPNEYNNDGWNRYSNVNTRSDIKSPNWRGNGFNRNNNFGGNSWSSGSSWDDSGFKLSYSAPAWDKTGSLPKMFNGKFVSSNRMFGKSQGKFGKFNEMYGASQRDLGTSHTKMGSSNGNFQTSYGSFGSPHGIYGSTRRRFESWPGRFTSGWINSDW